MKKTLGLILGILITATSVFASNGEGEKTTLEIDTQESKVYWTGKKVSGEHTGHLSIGDGTVYVKGDKIIGAEVNMDLNTIDCTDLSGEWKDKLVGHLKSDDFFSVEKHPNANFKITSIGHDGENSTVVGDLTIKGITHEITFPATLNVVNGVVKANGTASIDRTKWDIKYGSGKFFKGLGDRMIKDEFEIKFELTTKTGEGLTMN